MAIAKGHVHVRRRGAGDLIACQALELEADELMLDATTLLTGVLDAALLIATLDATTLLIAAWLVDFLPPPPPPLKRVLTVAVPLVSAAVCPFI